MGDAKIEVPNPKKTGGNPEIKYRVNDRPPFFLSIALALQHILAAFAGIVAVPLVVNNALGLSLEDNTFTIRHKIKQRCKFFIHTLAFLNFSVLHLCKQPFV